MYFFIDLIDKSGIRTKPEDDHIIFDSIYYLLINRTNYRKSKASSEKRKS